MMHGDKVPMFKMKALKGPLWSAVVIILFGTVYFFKAHADPGDIPAHGRSNALLMVCILFSGLLFILSTSRMWFKHLWHDRYSGKGRGGGRRRSSGRSRRTSR
jgi:hypothetical protein